MDSQYMYENATTNLFVQLLYTCKKEETCLFTKQPVYQLNNYQLFATNAGVEEQEPRWEKTHVTQEGAALKLVKETLMYEGNTVKNSLNLLMRKQSLCLK